MEKYEFKHLKDYKIKEEIVSDNLVKVQILNKGWQPVVFIFSNNYITCYGDIESFTWMCTWNTVEQILKGNCYANDSLYLLGKLEHKIELREFDYDEFTKTMDTAKEDHSSYLSESKKQEFLEKWESNQYLLDNVDGHRLDCVDEFFEAMEIEDYTEYYSHFFKMPVHYEIANEMLIAIENYFKERKTLTWDEISFTSKLEHMVVNLNGKNYILDYQDYGEFESIAIREPEFNTFLVTLNSNNASDIEKFNNLKLYKNS